MNNIDKIVTHPKMGHRDDLIAVSLILGAIKNNVAFGKAFPVIERKDPDEFELESDRVVVVDVGMKHSPQLLNFDHHGFSRDHVPECAISLILKHLNLYDVSKIIFKWLEPTEVLDSKGPVTLAKMYNIEKDILVPLLSPVENFLLSRCSSLEVLHPEDSFYKLLVDFGASTLRTIEDVEQRTSELNENSEVFSLEKGDQVIKVFDATFVPRDSQPTFYLEDYISANHPDVAVNITQDDRGEGYSLFRRNDHPAVDFSVYSDEKEVGVIKPEYDDSITFSHVGGFIAKTCDIDKKQAVSLISDAILE